MASTPDSQLDPHHRPDSQRPTARDVLPPVQAPTAGFLLQLFLIPMVIVLIIVVVWLMFSWLAHMGSDPKEIVRDLRTLNAASWQKAYTLSNMLRNPEHDGLKDDRELAGELASVLRAELRSGDQSVARIRLRVYLAKALGEFRVTEGVDTLLEAASTERGVAERDVRLAAIESLAVLAKNAGAERLRAEPRLLDTLVEAAGTRETGGTGARSADEIRSTAAFALGVIGGDEALQQLVLMLDDSVPNVRYNAATGLARQGDPRAERVLLEMLDPQNAPTIAGEVSDSQREMKRGMVLTNGLSAAAQLAKQHPDRPWEELKAAVEKLGSGDVPRAIRLRATEARAAFPG